MRTAKEIKRLISEAKEFMEIGVEPFPATLYVLQAKWDKEAKRAIDSKGQDVTNELFLILNTIRDDNSSL